MFAHARQSFSRHYRHFPRGLLHSFVDLRPPHSFHSLSSHSLRVQVIVRRVGKKTARGGARGYYGCNAAVFAGRLKGNEGGIGGAGGGGGAGGRGGGGDDIGDRVRQYDTVGDTTVAVKCVYNMEEQETNDLMDHYEEEFSFLSDHDVLPRHPNIIKCFHAFTDTASVANLPSWDVDDEFVRPSSLFIVMEPMVLPLSSVVRQRKMACDNQVRRCQADAMERGPLPLRCVFGLPCLALSPHAVEANNRDRSTWLNVTKHGV